MPYTLPNHRNFDQWLTELPDEDLQYFCDAIDPLAEDQVLAQETTAYLLYLILHFYGPHALSTEEMTDILRYFGINLAMVSFKVIPGSSHGLRNEIHNKQAIEHKWLPQAVSSCFIRLFAATFAWLQANEMTACQSQAQSQFTGKSISLLGCCHGVRRVLPYQCSLAGTPPWCVVSGLTVVCAWDTEPVSLFGRPPECLN